MCLFQRPYSQSSFHLQSIDICPSYIDFFSLKSGPDQRKAEQIISISLLHPLGNRKAAIQKLGRICICYQFSSYEFVMQYSTVCYIAHVFFVFLTCARFKSMILTFFLVFFLMKFKTWSYFGLAKHLQLWSQHKLNLTNGFTFSPRHSLPLAKMILTRK